MHRLIGSLRGTGSTEDSRTGSDVRGREPPGVRSSSRSTHGCCSRACLTFGGYAQGLPSAGSTTLASGNYVARHNPWVNWQGSTANGIPAADNLPFTAFPSDFATLPTVSVVVPDLQHDMHDGSIATA